MSQKLTLKDDIMFKAFFSRNEKYLKSFLSAIMGKRIKIKKVMHIWVKFFVAKLNKKIRLVKKD